MPTEPDRSTGSTVLENNCEGAMLRTDLSILRERSFLLLFSARSISVLGNAIAPVAIAFAILDMRNGSGTTLGLVLASSLTSRVLFVLYGGVLADRIPCDRLMIRADLAAGVAQGVIAVLVLRGSASTLNLAALSAVSGAASALFSPASRTVTVQLVPEEKLQSANALVQLSMTVGSIGGSAIAGLLVALLGSGWALAVDAASFLVSAALLTGIRLKGQVAVQPKARKLLAELKEGWHEFTSRQWVWTMVGQVSLVNLCISAGLMVLGPVVAKTRLGGASAWAIVLTAQAVGFAVGSLVALRIRPRRPIWTAALLPLGAVPPFVCLAFTAPVGVIAAAVFITGLCLTLYDVIFQTALQKHVPPESLSRVMSYDSFGSFIFLPVGMAVAAPIANLVGLDATLLGAASLTALASLVLLVLPSIKAVSDEAEQPIQLATQAATGSG